MIVLQLALLLLPAQQPTELVQATPAEPRRGMADLRWNGQAVQVRPAKPEVVLTPTEPRLELKVEPRLELRLAPVVESHDPVQELRAPARQGRSWIGVELTSDDQGEAELEVGRVIEGSPAERAELEEGDRLVALDGEPLSSFQDLRERLDQRHPGQRVKLTVQRTLSVELDQRGYGEQGKPRLGVRLAEDDHGLATDSVESGWPAEAAGLRAGDIIKSIEGREVHTTSDLTGVLGEIEPGDSVEIGIERSVKLELGTFPGEEGQAPGGGAFSFEVPQDRGRGRMDEAPQEPPHIFGLPRGGGELQPAPRGAQPRAESQGSGLEAELRSLRDELRSLREELRALRSELDELRRANAERGGRQAIGR